MRLVRRRPVAPAVPAAALANLVLLATAFFVWTYNPGVDKASVALPATGLRVEVPRKAAVVSITENGQVRVSEGTAASIAISRPEDLLTFASEIVAADANKAFALKADRALPYATVDRVIQVLKQARVRVVYLLSEAAPPPGGG